MEKNFKIYNIKKSMFLIVGKQNGFCVDTGDNNSQYKAL